jgi:hypothetical protein
MRIGRAATVVVAIAPICLGVPFAIEAQGIARVPPIGAKADTQTRSHRETLR